MMEDCPNLSGDIDVEQPPMLEKKSGSESFSKREWFQSQRDSVRPWGEFLNGQKFKVPRSVAPLGQRVVRNVARFQSNYLFVFLGLLAFCLLTSPVLLIAMAACLGACYIISIKNAERAVSIMGHEVTLPQQYAAVALASFPLFWIAGAGSAVFWVIGASIFVIALHSALYSADEEAAPFELQMETV